MNLDRILNGLVSSGVAGGLAGGAASALLVQGLGSGKGRKAARLGGAALIGGLAWRAYEQYRRRQDEPPGDGGVTLAERARGGERWHGLTRDEFEPLRQAATARRDLLVLRAMVTAAHADGHIDTNERIRIYDRIETLDLSHAERGMLLEEISAPLTTDQLVQQVPSRALATEVYLAALLMCGDRSPVHRRFLQDLAEQLALPAELVQSLEEEVGVEAYLARPDIAPNRRLTVSPQA